MEATRPDYNRLTFCKTGCQTMPFYPAVWLTCFVLVSGILQDKNTDLLECGG